MTTRECMKVVGEMIFRRVRIRNRPPQRALNATRRRQNIDPDVVGLIPQSDKVGRIVVCGFQSAGIIDNDHLMMEYDRHGLKPSPMAQIALNRADAAVAIRYPNLTHFQDSDGKWCYVGFMEDFVLVHRSGVYYNAGLWFLGVSK